MWVKFQDWGVHVGLGFRVGVQGWGAGLGFRGLGFRVGVQGWGSGLGFRVGV